MSCRPIIRDLRCRNDIVCRSCLSRLTRQPAQPWIAAYSTQTSSKPKPQLPPSSSKRLAGHPLKAELAQYLQGGKGLRDSEKEKGQEDGNFSVRFFEQDDKKRTELPNEQAFGESLRSFEISELKDALLDLKGGIGTQDEKDAFKAVLEDVGQGWDSMQSADDLEKMIAKMEAYTKSIDAEIKETGMDLPKDILDEMTADMPELQLMEEESHLRKSAPYIPEKKWTINQARKIRKLNAVLRRVFQESLQSPRLKKKSVHAVYKAYHATRLTLALSWSTVTPRVWDFLWKVFSIEDETINAHRLEHIALLARDMSEARVTLSPLQQLLAMEAVFIDGWESKAIENWKRCKADLGSQNATTFQDFWELGARMWLRVGNMEQAEQAIDKLLDRQMNPRILMALIRTCCEQGTEESQERAWDAYRQMRKLLGKEMKLSDYDQVISYFLTVNDVENALNVFVHMMSDGQIDLKRRSYMPSVVGNKFFLGKWLKRLIGAGDMDGAWRVVEFMRIKGVEASPIQLNGLIGAWQRSGGVDDVKKAEALAWRMIRRRIEFVSIRKSNGGENPKLSDRADAGLPRATIETFSLLAENYRLRGFHGQLETLWDAFRSAEISPDAFMMNQLLESHIQEGRSKEALALYRSFVDDRGVVPDPYTFSALWKTLAINRLHIVAQDAIEGEIEATRSLFNETIRFKDIFEPDGMDGQLARKILHTFRRLNDNAGFLVALTVLKDLFKFLPPEALVLEMVLGTTKLSWDTASQRQRLLLAKRDLDVELLARAGGDAEKLEAGERGEALYEYLQKKFWPKLDDEDERRMMLLEAAKQMGVYELLAPRKGAGGRRR